jgi:TubC N-terminal docking domain
MSPETILAEAARLGVRLFAKEGGSLGYDAPAGSLTPELRAALVENKAAILTLLSSATPAPWRPRELPWRSVVGRWPVGRRERWGRLANELAEAGHEWPDDEAEAFRRLTAGNHELRQADTTRANRA